MSDLLTDDELDLDEQEQRRRAGALQAVENKKVKRGRKPANESQATAIRARLVMWKQVPESQRVSLRALAVELATSHQLLAFYLRGLDEWQRKDYERRAEDIRHRAATENRPMTYWEESQVEGLDRAAFHCMIESGAADMLKRLEADAKAGRLTGVQLKTVKILAQQWGMPAAQKILQKHTAQKTSHEKMKSAGRGAPQMVEFMTVSEKGLIRQPTPEERQEFNKALRKNRTGRRMVKKRRIICHLLGPGRDKSFKCAEPDAGNSAKMPSHAVS
jgi:hypothetical protein